MRGGHLSHLCHLEALGHGGYGAKLGPTAQNSVQSCLLLSPKTWAWTLGQCASAVPAPAPSGTFSSFLPPPPDPPFSSLHVEQRCVHVSVLLSVPLFPCSLFLFPASPSFGVFRAFEGPRGMAQGRVSWVGGAQPEGAPCPWAAWGALGRVGDERGCDPQLLWAEGQPVAWTSWGAPSTHSPRYHWILQTCD